MSFNIKKQKKHKSVTVYDKNIDDLHIQKLESYSNSRKKLQKRLLTCKDIEKKLIRDEISEIDKSEMDYLLKVSNILRDYTMSTDNSTKKHLTEMYKKELDIPYVTNLAIADKYCNCNIEKIQTSEGFVTCSSCGVTEPDKLLEGLNYEDECNIKEKFVFDYKRINYFTEWLSQLQANESTHIPDEILENVKIELKKRNIKDTSKININVIKKILKDLDSSKYYEHIPLIISRITGCKPLIIEPSLNNELRQMFLLIQEPFEELKGDRKNFLSYPYILYKFFEILEIQEYLKYFTLLKSREKLLKSDMLWKSIVNKIYLKTGDPRWVFIPSC